MMHCGLSLSMVHIELPMTIGFVHSINFLARSSKCNPQSVVPFFRCDQVLQPSTRNLTLRTLWLVWQKRIPHGMPSGWRKPRASTVHSSPSPRQLPARTITTRPSTWMRCGTRTSCTPASTTRIVHSSSGITSIMRLPERSACARETVEVDATETVLSFLEGSSCSATGAFLVVYT